MSISPGPRLAPKTVAVIGSGNDAHEQLAVPIGQMLARLGVNLLTGGGNGVMAAVARAFVEANPALGISIGILPASRQDPATPVPGYPNEFVQLPIVTHLSERGRHGHLQGSRNHINILSADAIVALPGSYGTESELRLALQYQKKTVVYCCDDESVDRFPTNLPQYKNVADVEAFLRHALGMQ